MRDEQPSASVGELSVDLTAAAAGAADDGMASFAASDRVPLLVAASVSPSAAVRPSKQPPPSRFRSLEFLVYIAVSYNTSHTSHATPQQLDRLPRIHRAFTY